MPSTRFSFSFPLSFSLLFLLINRVRNNLNLHRGFPSPKQSHVGETAEAVLGANARVKNARCGLNETLYHSHDGAMLQLKKGDARAHGSTAGMARNGGA